ALGLPDDPDQPHTVTDQLDGTTYTWRGSNYVRLDPHTKPAHVFTFERNGRVRAGDGQGGGASRSRRR
ncbi:hypothetical protein AB0C69_41595, partial [Actinomadura sp. NPDC048032]|uniref:hypothetical protein n=1 Tax=Actinomadura sp. NPDC048032 TaxID=3155747 RepID=UPI00340EE5E9